MFSLTREENHKHKDLRSEKEYDISSSNKKKRRKQVSWADGFEAPLPGPINEEEKPPVFNFNKGLEVAKSKSQSFFEKYGISNMKDRIVNLKSKVTLGVKIGLAVTILAVVVGGVYFYKGDKREDVDDEEEEDKEEKRPKQNKKKINKKRQRDAQIAEDTGLSNAARMQEQAFKDYSNRLWQLKNKGSNLLAHINQLKETQGKVGSLYNSLNGSTDLDPGVGNSSVTLGSEGFGTAFLLPEERQEQNKMSGYQLQQVSNELTKSEQELSYLTQQFNTVMTEFTKAFGPQERMRMEAALKKS